MKTHSQLGFNMLKSSRQPILQMGAIIAHQHHEKYDGSGYQKGLVSDEISIFARITAITDVFDALGSDRCYKKAWDLDKIINLFKEERGHHFDPVLTDLFLNNIKLFINIRNKYR